MPINKHWILLVFVLSIGVGLSALPDQAPAPTGDPPSRSWKRVRSRSFTAVGDASVEDLRDVLRELEAHRLARLGLTPWLASPREAGVTAVFFDRRTDLAAVGPLDALNRPQSVDRSFLLGDDSQSFFMVSQPIAGLRGSHFEPALAGYTALLVNGLLPQAPDWLREGLRIFLSTFVPRVPSADRYVGGPPLVLGPQVDQLRMLPLERVFASAGLQGSDTERTAFVVTAWRLVHYLVLGPPARVGQMPGHIESLRAGLPPGAAMTARFNTPLGTLDVELARYNHAAAWEASRAELDRAVGSAAAEPLKESEVAALRGQLLVLAGRSRDAVPRLDEALAKNPGSVDARVAKASVLGLRGRDMEALSLLDGLLCSDASAVKVCLAMGQTLLALGRYPEAFTHFERATALSPRSLAAWIGLSVTALATGRSAVVERAAATADQLAPRGYWSYRRAITLVRVPEMEAEIVREAQRDVAREGWEAAAYSVFLASLAHRRVGQDAEANALLGELIPHLPRDSWPLRVARFLRGLLPAKDFLSGAKDDGQRTEAHAYIGLVASGKQDLEVAMPHLQWVIDHDLQSFTEYSIVLNELRRLGLAPKNP